MISEFFESLNIKWETVQSLFSQEALVYNLAVVLLCLLSELAIIGWGKSSLRKIIKPGSSVKSDIFYALVSVFNLANLFSLVLSLGVFQLLSKLVFEATNWQLTLHIENVYWQFLVIFLISDLKGYASHWLHHHFKTLWQLHAFHHSATDFSILTRYRIHYLEIAIGKFINVIPYAIFGAPIATFFIITFLEEVHQLIIHSNIKSNFGVLGKVLVSPDAHRVHHSESKEDYGKNFGTLLIIWDKLFGTYKAPTEPVSVGLEDNPYNQKGVIKDLWLSMKNASVSLAENFRKP